MTRNRWKNPKYICSKNLNIVFPDLGSQTDLPNRQTFLSSHNNIEEADESNEAEPAYESYDFAELANTAKLANKVNEIIISICINVNISKSKSICISVSRSRIVGEVIGV